MIEQNGNESSAAATPNGSTEIIHAGKYKQRTLYTKTSDCEVGMLKKNYMRDKCD